MEGRKGLSNGFSLGVSKDHFYKDGVGEALLGGLPVILKHCQLG